MCESLQDLLEAPGLFIEKLSRFLVEEDGKHVFKRPLSESNCKSVISAIKENIKFDGFKGSDEEDKEEELVGYTPELKYFAQQENMIDSIAEVYVEKSLTT
ncbi:hypothetical protein DPMN_115997 [Dreissena polymorpha]|uniref:Uncharacterized protein n=1 Tax=Dreissena polymorpha TaxID=45954 RepID=A0A9D4KNX8_DREPO|nr:hypothetical protein DPMN_115997 [Dreissena polymorpha]